MNEETSLLYPSLPECFMPKRKRVIVVIKYPRWYFRIFQKDKVFESFAGYYFATYFSLNDCFLSDLDIIQRSFYEARHNNRSIFSFIEVETIV